jgi:hypothetical protein
MAAVKKLRSLLKGKKGDEAVSFLLTTAMLIFIFATLISAMVYIIAILRRELSLPQGRAKHRNQGVYDETETQASLTCWLVQGWRT